MRSLLRLLMSAACLLGCLCWAQELEQVTRVGAETRDDDSPSIAAAPDGSVWVAFLSYSDRRDEIGLRHYTEEKGWGSLTFVPGTSGDAWAPWVGVDAEGRVWVVWSQGLDGNWDLYARRYQPAPESDDDPTWGPLVRLTDDPLPDVNPRLAVDGKGGFAVVWQGWRGRFASIFSRTFDGTDWAPTVRVSAGPANNWHPAAAYDSSGTLWVAWDSYRRGNYDVYLAGVAGDRVSEPEIAVAQTPRFEARPTVAVDGEDRVWVAWEEGRPNWGKDTGYTIADRAPGVMLGRDRWVRTRVLAGGRLQQPTMPLQNAFDDVPRKPGWTYQPHIFGDRRGAVWVGAKLRLAPREQNPNRGYWEYYLTRYADGVWTPAKAIPQSWGRSSTRLTAAVGNDALWFAWPTDRRDERQTHRPRKGEVYAGTSAFAAPGAVRLETARDEPIEVKPGHSNEAADLDAVRGYRTAVHGRPVQIVRGDFHRHTELSWDGGGGTDGSLQDFYRYMIDAAAMDFGASTDHQGGSWPYWWWYSQKMTDMYHLPGNYTALFAFERSLTQPFGHRNILYAERTGEVIPFFMRTDSERYRMGQNAAGDMPPVGTGDAVRNDTELLYERVRRMNGVAVSHTSGTRMGTDWSDPIDSELEPVVEIFQGARTNYEALGAPLTVVEGVDDQHAQRAGYFPEGFVRNAWDKGYKLGIVTSSDHGSTHYSYAMVYTDRPTRQGILDAMRRRHTYGATDNILLEVRMGESYFMGDELRTHEPLPIRVKVRGTGPLERVLILRDSEIVYAHAPDGEQEAAFEYVDRHAGDLEGTHYYYVRVEQEDKQIAWASPIWVTY